MKATLEDELADFRALYEREGNPLYVWWAIGLTASTDLGIPDWCQQYLAGCAQKIIEIANTRKPSIEGKDQAALTALGMVRAGWNSFRAFEIDAEAVAIERHFAWAAENNSKIEAEVATVREVTGKFRSTIFNRKASAPKLKALRPEVRRGKKLKSS